MIRECLIGAAILLLIAGALASNGPMMLIAAILVLATVVEYR